MRVAITGGTGFLGRAVARAWVESGADDVRVVARSTHAELDALDVVQIRASVLDDRALAEAIEGSDVVYHLAGMVSRDPADAETMRALHVDGTERVLAAALAAGAQRVVYASSSGTIGCFKTPDGIADHSADFCDDLTHHWPYYVTKIAAERALWAFHRRTGFPVISLNPSLILGPGDDRCSSTGDVKLFLQGKLPSVPWGGLSYVDVRDLAPAFVSAATEGEVGTRYPLGAVNCTMAEFLTDLERLSGVKGPRLKLPKPLELAGARVLEGVMRRLGKTPNLDHASAQMSQLYWYIDSERTKVDLGFAPRPTDETLRATIDDVRGRIG
jgi:dihydroflavonol-4-reductase